MTGGNGLGAFPGLRPGQAETESTLRQIRRGSVLFFVFLVFGAFPAAAEPVDLELVLAVDVSGSMDDEEHALQRMGYISAIAHPQVVQVIQGGYTGRIAVTYVEWAGAGLQVVAVPWRVIDGQETATDFAETLANTPIAFIRGTSISGGIDFASKLFDDNGFEGMRRVIDVSGDGPNNRGQPVARVRDRVVAQGIVINGLPIMLHASRGYWSMGGDLEAYYRDCVIGGRGAFVVGVREPVELARAIRRKLILEIAGREPTPEPAITPVTWNGLAVPVQRGPIDCLIGEKMRRDWYEE